MIELGYKKIGSGKTNIVFLHELMGNHENYKSALPYFDLEKHTLYLVDLRAYGLSFNIKGEYTCDEASNDVKNLLDTLELKNVHLLAHSMSTMIAQKLALLSNSIVSLILISPISPAGIKMSEKSQNKLLHDMKNDPKNIENIVRSASIRHNETWIQNRIQMAASASRCEARVGYMKMYLETDFKEKAKELSLPIYIIVGKHDFVIFSLKTVKRLFQEIYKNTTILECQEAGHYVMLECPVYFATQIEKFVKENSK